MATADSRMYRDKTRRKQADLPDAAMATGTDGRGGLVPRPMVADVSDVDLQRAGFGVL
jgi:hypothetical protein